MLLGLEALELEDELEDELELELLELGLSNVVEDKLELLEPEGPEPLSTTHLTKPSLSSSESALLNVNFLKSKRGFI
ncbi:hypothetical protein AGMMS49593_07650 [Endomicrobiia bacterium]|nr:hypothetical protein AGMMS49593_07650 [Endomicrobiia bacterium]